MNQELSAISPIDGRYKNKVSELSAYFSEFGLIKYRVRVEVEYFIAISELGLKGLSKLKEKSMEDARQIYLAFSPEDAQRIKDIEKITNHDVKAVEYFLKEMFDSIGLGKHKEFLHFGLTSQDINNTATPLSLKEAMKEVFFPTVQALLDQLSGLANDWKNIAMLARTHGQPASPTRLGKEIEVFVKRLQIQFNDLKNLPYPAKFGGATGNFNAHQLAYPEIDWAAFGNSFVNETLGLDRSFPTTQIEHYDRLAAIFDNLSRINTILIDFARDLWTYISMDYFKQEIKKGEIGSSAMPHKVNPIDFENAEGNLGLANAIFRHLSEKLPVSRLQRDLTDSTVLRNIGVPISHSLIAILSLKKGIGKLIVNEKKIEEDLDDNWAVVAEGIQTILRRENYPKPYEALLELTRTNEKIDKKAIANFITKLKVSDEIKNELMKISPKTYTGI
ncbi:MAG: adenylosuccinate lyase [Bacteroidales bacterium]|nr:adenylosuccinate lyase [Bacteroidales bacterium]MCF8390177.1 adenylosuccinate lyase [Bacteroidales bacterium]